MHPGRAPLGAVTVFSKIPGPHSAHPRSVWLGQPKMSLDMARCPLGQNRPRLRTPLRVWVTPSLSGNRACGCPHPPPPPPTLIASVGSGVQFLPLWAGGHPGQGHGRLWPWQLVPRGVDMLVGEDRKGRGIGGGKHMYKGRGTNRCGVCLARGPGGEAEPGGKQAGEEGIMEAGQGASCLPRGLSHWASSQLPSR